MPRATDSPSLTQSVYERLRSDLLACRLRPGDRLRINEICQRLDVGLSAVREALSRLTSEGLVMAEPQRGFRAAPISAADLIDLTMARVEIEGLCLRRAIVLGEIDWEERLVAAHHRLSRTSEREPGDPRCVSESFAEAHAFYHHALVSGCGSVWLMRLRDGLYAQSERYRRLSVPLAREDRDLGREHREIMEASLARDADAAVARLTAHFELTTSILLHAELPEGSTDEGMRRRRPASVAST